MFFYLKAREGFMHLMGVDYSQAAINLARSVASSHGYDFIQFKVNKCINKTYLLIVVYLYVPFMFTREMVSCSF